MQTMNLNWEVAYRVTFQMQVPKARGPEEARDWAEKEAFKAIGAGNWDRTRWEPTIQSIVVKPIGMTVEPVAGMEWVDCEIVFYAREVK